ncbi:hypothetical protein ACP1Y1_004817, partial [Escherichia coli]
FSSGAGRTSDGNGSHASTLKSPSYTKSVSWQHYQKAYTTLLALTQEWTFLSHYNTLRRSVCDHLDLDSIFPPQVFSYIHPS